MPNGQDATLDPRPASVGAAVASETAGANSPAVEFRNIDIAYGKFVAVRDFSLSIRKGSFVTHDQEEALSMSDRIVVMNAGSAEQIGTPEEVYERPATAFVADFLGKANMLSGTVTRSDGPTLVTLEGGQTVSVLLPKPLTQGSAVIVVVRPQKLSVGRASANRLPGRVVSASYLGGSAIYEVDIGGKTNIRANAAIDGRVLREGEAIELGFDPDDCVLLDGDGRRIS